MWSVKHKPKSLSEFHGTPKAVEFMTAWDGSPLIIHGKTGVGKTLLAELTAVEKGWDIVKVDSDNIDVLKNSAATKSLFGGRKLFLVEDVDEQNTTKLADFINVCKNPLIMTTRDYSSRKLSTLKKKCGELQLRKPMAASIGAFLKTVCDAEGIEAEKDVLKELGKNAGGDYRAALHDLEALSAGSKKITEKDLEQLYPRDVKKDIYACMSTVFGGRDLKEVVESTWNIGEQPKDVLYWIEENTPLLYSSKESRTRAFEHLSRADIFLGRIQNRQYWGFLRYANPLMTGGVNLSRPDKVNYVQYKFPSAWISMSRAKTAKNMKKSIGEKLAPLLHASSTVIARQYIPLFKTLYEKKKITDKDFEDYGLEKEEVDFILS
ncbi:MAG TPA: hypothetical protein ENN13_02700 [Candidatus Altiarchaeales archaeon]|nr:hypothetical protein [Candidatus Altiarchaeales archaeon]